MFICLTENRKREHFLVYSLFLAGMDFALNANQFAFKSLSDFVLVSYSCVMKYTRGAESIKTNGNSLWF